MAEIDNFDLLREKLTFEPITELRRNKHGDIESHKYDVDQYDIHILRRVKDCKELGNTLGSNEAQRMIKTYEVRGLEYFDRKKEAIKELCKANNARAYLLLQVRDSREYLLALQDKLNECLRKKNYGVKIEHLMRSAFCGLKSSRKPVWMLDIDYNEMSSWTKDEICKVIETTLASAGFGMEDVYEVPTRNGFHIIIPPMNTKMANELCPFIFADAKKGYDFEKIREFFDPQHTMSDDQFEMTYGLSFTIRDPFCVGRVHEQLTHAMNMSSKAIAEFDSKCMKSFAGWLHKDATTLLYAP